MKGNGIRTITILIVFCLLLSMTGLTALAAETPFTDVADHAWYRHAVQWAAEQEPKIIYGTTPTTFSPDDTCTRAQIVTLLWRWAGCPDDDYPECGFADIRDDAYSATAIHWAVFCGITKGTSPTTFSPDDPCTRAQIVTFLHRIWELFAQTPSYSENPFTDVAADKYYTNSVLWAVNEGITKGTTDITFSPEEPCDRSQAVTFLYRLVGSYRYANDPRLNSRAMADIVLDRDAVFGFRPSETGSLKQFADADWTDPELVAEWQRDRIDYHKSMEELYDMIEEMQNEGKTTEEIARAVSTRRNEIRLEAYADDPEGLERLKARNLEQYGHEEGPLPEELYEKYGSWTMVIAKALSVNSGMDACLGLYDDYFALYVAVGQVELSTATYH